jgi:hypothetical protein
MRFVLCRAFVAALALCVVLGAQLAMASDIDNDPIPTSSRHGFIIGVALGPGFTRVSQGVEPSYANAGFDDFDVAANKFAVNSDFKIGFAADDRTLLYWNTKVSWFRQEISSFDWDENSGQFRTISKDETFASSLSGLGLSYYFRDALPSGYISLTMGFASLSMPFKDNSHGEGGFGAAAGLGYEFAPHLTFEGTLSYCHTSNDPVKTDVISLKAVFGLLSF